MEDSQETSPHCRHMQRQAQQLRRSARHELFQIHRNITVQHSNLPPQLILDPRLANELTTLYEMKVNGSQILSFAEAVRSGEIHRQHFGVIGLRRLQNEDSRHPANEFTVTNLIPLLVRLLGEGEWPQLQFETTRMITNLSESSLLSELIQESNGVEMLLELLSSELEPIRMQSICALGNLSQATVRIRDLIIRKGGLVQIARLAENQSGDMFSHCCWALANLCNGNPAPRFPLIKSALPIICEGVRAEVFKGWIAETDCLQILARECKTIADRIQILLDGKLLPKLLANLQSEHFSIVLFSLIVLQHIADGNSAQKDELLSIGILPYLAKMLDYPKIAVRREACAVLSSLADSEDPRHGAAVMGWAGMLDAVAHLILADTCEVKAEVCYILMGLMKTGEPTTMKIMVKEHGLLRSCLDMMASELAETVEGGARCLESILRLAKQFKEEWVRMGGVEVLERLQYHRSNEVYETVSRIMENNFALEPL